MSTAATPIPDPHGEHAAGHNGHAHNPHLAHHFDTPEQQIASGKLGIWLFLATEILMFGGLFCAYSVYRHNHPEVFSYAHNYLNKWLGGINTVVLIASSLTMAWGVRASQLGKNGQLAACLVATIMGGYVFMGIKAIEYRDKWEHHLWIGEGNQYRKPTSGGPAAASAAAATPAPATHGAADTHAAPAAAPAAAGHGATAESHGSAPMHAEPKPAAPVHQAIVPVVDPNAGSPDAAAVKPPSFVPGGSLIVADNPKSAGHGDSHDNLGLTSNAYLSLDARSQQRVYTFFQTYFVMTGLHGVHVLVGMALIFWILLRAVGKPNRQWVLPLGFMSIGMFLLYVVAILPKSPQMASALSSTSTVAWVIVALTGAWFAMGVVRARASRLAPQPEFGPDYYAPVDITGLYWHIVDLIWIFLFPLLYLIH